MAGQETSFKAYSYRTSSRFGSRVRVSVDGQTVSVTGPRVGVIIYRLWIAAQLVLFWAIVPVLLVAAVLWDWRYLVVALVLAIAHWAVSTFGAVCLWELENVKAFTAGTEGQTTTFAVSAVKRVTVGRGWARKGLWLVIAPYVAGINKMAEGYAVSFEAPAGERDEDMVYALHMQTKEEAQALVRLL
ncbi:MAG: hypothetical protein WBW48_08600 [Anaerolineae bacterium]